MNSLERSVGFVRGSGVDRPPFHPIVMRFAARHAGIPYREFCLVPARKCEGMIGCAEAFGADWVTVMSDPYAEAEAFGLSVTYPENDLPQAAVRLLQSAEDGRKLKVCPVESHPRLTARVEEIQEYQRRVGESCLIVGWVEGPFAEYVNLRGLSEACLDLYDEPEAVEAACEVIVENALGFITAQVRAGAHCIGIGDAACSQISPGLYRRLFFERQQSLVNHVHSLGAIAKLHICGNTTAILSDLVRTGADIVDVDHLVGSMKQVATELGPHQVLSGNADPVRVIQDGRPAEIREFVRNCYCETGGRCIVSAGCEITPGTNVENLRAMRAAALALGRQAP